MNTILIDLSVFKQLKMAAKRLSKSSGKKHTECLDIIARKHGFPSWHKVTQAYAPYRAALDVWKEGIVVILDWKEAESVNRNMLIENDLMFEIAFPSMLQHASVEGVERPLSEQDFYEIFDYWFHAFFLKVDAIPSNFDLNWLHYELKKYSFFMPLATFWKGEPVFEASQILDSVPPVKSVAYFWADLFNQFHPALWQIPAFTGWFPALRAPISIFADLFPGCFGLFKALSASLGRSYPIARLSPLSTTQRRVL